MLNRAYLLRIRHAAEMMRTYKNWPTAYANRLATEHPSRPVRYKLRGGPIVEMDRGPHDVRVINEVWASRIYQPDKSFHPQPGWLVLDIGAHKGMFTVQAARDGARVIAIEPAPYNLVRLRTNLALNNLENVTVIEAAVAEHAGTMAMVLDAANSGRGRLAADADADAGTTQVQSLTLEDVVATAGDGVVDLVKMDIEGGELDVLLTSPRHVLRRIRRMIFEYHPLAGTAEETAKSLVAALQTHGFRCRVRREHTLVDAVLASEGAARRGPA